MRVNPGTAGSEVRQENWLLDKMNVGVEFRKCVWLAIIRWFMQSAG